MVTKGGIKKVTKTGKCWSPL